MSRERHVITGSPMILSFANNGVRSSGDILVSGVPTSPFYQYSTSIVDQANFNAYADLAVANTGLLSTSAAISLDGLFVGYSTYYDYVGILPHFEQPTDLANPNVGSLNPFNPSSMFGTGVKNTGILDSGVFNTGVWISGGHSITSALIYDAYASTGSIDKNVHPISNHFDADFYIRKKTELNNIRSIAHRLPMVGAGWGYDINGSPVPASGDDLHPNALWDSRIWKVGPIDLRWDDSRKVWTAGGSGGGNRIRFVVEEVYCPDGYDITELYVRVRYTYYDGGCTKVPPGVDGYDGLIDVYDSCVLSYYVAEDLIGREGSATYFYPKSESDYDTCVPRWIVDSICGEPTCA